MLDVQMHPPFAAPSLNNLITLPSPIPSSSLPPPNPIPPPLSHLHVGLGDSVATEEGPSVGEALLKHIPRLEILGERRLVLVLIIAAKPRLVRPVVDVVVH